MTIKLIQEILWDLGAILSITAFGIQIWMLIRMKKLTSDVSEVEQTVEEIQGEIHEHLSEEERENKNGKI
jgi:uncharacterized protein YoxC